MAYQKINKERFEFLLQFGTSEDELRRFFVENRTALIIKGAKVQNLPRGTPARVGILVNGLRPDTDTILQKWFSASLSMLDPASVDEVIETFKLYEEADESLPENEAKRLSRSCLLHLFSPEPSSELIEFLRTPLRAEENENERQSEEDEQQSEEEMNPLSAPQREVAEDNLLELGLSDALVALVEGKDPDEFVGKLPPRIAAFVSGLYDAHVGNQEQVESALEEMKEYPQASQLLREFAVKHARSKRDWKPELSGLKLFSLEEPSRLEFDEERDEIVGLCTTAREETKVFFVRPIAIRTRSGNFISLAKAEHRENLFPLSGDIAALSGHKYPRQPKQGEIAIWRVAKNETSGQQHRTNYHLSSEKTEVYEIRQVPFKSYEYDSVREYIKQQTISSNQGRSASAPLLFVLRDGLIVGSRQDLSRDEAFEGGIPSWRTLSGFRFENSILVPGPLPAHEVYECEPLAVSLRKLLAKDKRAGELLTKQQIKFITGLVGSGEARLNKDRMERLIRELTDIEEDQDAIKEVLNFVVASEPIQRRIDTLVQEEALHRSAQKDGLVGEIRKAEERLADIKAQIEQQEKEQKALPRSLAKAVASAVEKAKQHAVETLGESVVLQAVMGGSTALPAESAHSSRVPCSSYRSISPVPNSLVSTLLAVGVNPKYANAIELAKSMAHATGIIFATEGTASRIAAESWVESLDKGGVAFECEVGLTADSGIREVLAASPAAIAILGANLSPIDIYARALIDGALRRLAQDRHAGSFPDVILALSDGVAALPLPASVQSILFRINLDRLPEFLSEDEASQILEDIGDSADSEVWFSRMWRPAGKRVLAHLRALPPDELAQVLSIIRLKHEGESADSA